MRSTTCSSRVFTRVWNASSEVTGASEPSGGFGFTGVTVVAEEVAAGAAPAGAGFAGAELGGGGVAWMDLSPVRIGAISPAPAAGSARESGSAGSGSEDCAWTEKLAISVRAARSTR